MIYLTDKWGLCLKNNTLCNCCKYWVWETWLLDPPIRNHFHRKYAESCWFRPIRAQQGFRPIRSQESAPGSRDFPSYLKPTQSPHNLSYCWTFAMWSCFEIYKPDMWLTSNSNLVIILAFRALRRFRGDLRGSTARIDIAVSVTYY